MHRPSDSVGDGYFGFVGRAQSKFQRVVFCSVKGPSFFGGPLCCLDEEFSQRGIATPTLGSFFLPADSLLPDATPNHNLSVENIKTEKDVVDHLKKGNPLVMGLAVRWRRIRYFDDSLMGPEVQGYGVEKEVVPERDVMHHGLVALRYLEGADKVLVVDQDGTYSAYRPSELITSRNNNFGYILGVEPLVPRDH
jgi:hypothetical protein